MSSKLPIEETSLDAFLLAEGVKGRPLGKLKEWGEADHTGWYYFKFANGSLMCSPKVALTLGICYEKDGEIHVRDDI